MSREVEPLLADLRRDLTALTELVCAAVAKAARLLSDKAIGATEPISAAGPEVLTSGEAAELLRVSRRTLERLPLSYAKVGRLRRYLRSDILEWLRQKANVEPGELFERERNPPKRGK